MMKRILCILSILCVIDLAAMAQGAPPLRVKEVDGSPNKLGISTLVVSNGTLTISGSTATISISTQPVNDMTDTWTNGATAYTAIKMNVTNTASAAASNLIDLQIGGTSFFKVQKDGKTGINVGASAPTRMLSVNQTAIIGSGTSSSDISATLWLYQSSVNLTSYDSGSVYYGLAVNSVNGTTPLIALGTKSGTDGILAFHQSANNLRIGYENNGPFTEAVRVTGSLRLSLMAAATANPGTSELTSLGAASLYVKGSKFVIAYNNAGTITYITIPLDGSTATLTQSTSAP